MTREPDPAARRVTISLDEMWTLVVDRFEDYDELVEAHIHWEPGVRAAGYVLDIGAALDRHATLEQARVQARAAAPAVMKLVEMLGPYYENPPRDVDEMAERLIQGAGRDPANMRFAAHRVAERSRRGARSLSVKELREIVTYWDEVYDDHLGDEAGRRAAVAKRFGLGVRKLGDAFADARRNGLSYRGMRGR